MKRAILIIISTILLIGCRGGGFISVGDDDFPITLTFTQYEGVNTYITNPKEQEDIFILKDRNDFEKVYEFYNPTKIAPIIDFNRYEVIAIIDKTQRSGGYYLKVDKVKEYEDYIEIDLTEKIPGDDCIVTLALTEPFVFVKIIKSSKSIKIKKRQEIYSCL